MSLDSYIIPYTKINFRWIVDLNAKTKTMFSEDNLECLRDFGVSKDFLNRIQRTPNIKERLII